MRYEIATIDAVVSLAVLVWVLPPAWMH